MSESGSPDCVSDLGDASQPPPQPPLKTLRGSSGGFGGILGSWGGLGRILAKILGQRVRILAKIWDGEPLGYAIAAFCAHQRVGETPPEPTRGGSRQKRRLGNILFLVERQVGTERCHICVGAAPTHLWYHAATPGGCKGVGVLLRQRIALCVFDVVCVCVVLSRLVFCVCVAECVCVVVRVRVVNVSIVLCVCVFVYACVRV